MESVGQTLREARSRLGLTLEQVSAVTRINLRNLMAIESNDLSSISSPFLYRSFVRQFATAVKVDYDAISGAVQVAANTMPQPLVPGQEDSHLIHVSAIKPKRAWSLSWLRSVVSFSLVMAACTGAYAMWQRSHADWHALVADITAQIQNARSSLMRHETLPQRPKVETVRPKQQPVVQPFRDQPVDSEFHVQLAAIERSWLSIVSDGKEVFSGILDASETKILEGRESARIRTGNAGGLKFTFNGKQIGILGPRGQVRTVVFTKNNYEVLPSAPQAAWAIFTQNVD